MSRHHVGFGPAPLLTVALRRGMALATGPVSAPVAVGVHGGELVAVPTIRLGRTTGLDRGAAQDIVAVGHGLKMSRVAAQRVPAKVIEF